MIVSDLLKEASITLQPTRITCAADRDLGRLEAELLLGFVMKKEKTWLLIHGEATISPPRLRQFQVLVKRRLKHEPVAYLIGEREFFGRQFVVNKNVLIPRPETELMVERAIKLTQDDRTNRTTGSISPSSRRPVRPAQPIVWDVGTGSGAIAVTLAAEIPSATILATDISSKALMVAKKNATKNHVAKKITFLKSDLLQPAAYRWLKDRGQGTGYRVRKNNHRTRYPVPGTLIITANLPYLPTSDKKVLAPDVVKYEPSSALFSGSDGLVLIKKFLGQLSRHLPEWNYQHVTMLFEFDPPQVMELRHIAKKYFPAASITIHQDLAGRDRMMEVVV